MSVLSISGTLKCRKFAIFAVVFPICIEWVLHSADRKKKRLYIIVLNKCLLHVNMRFLVLVFCSLFFAHALRSTFFPFLLTLLHLSGAHQKAINSYIIIIMCTFNIFTCVYSLDEHLTVGHTQSFCVIYAISTKPKYNGRKMRGFMESQQKWEWKPCVFLEREKKVQNFHQDEWIIYFIK